jgi:hypothetical protein
MSRIPEELGVAVTQFLRVVEIVTVKELLRYSTVIVTMRYTHTNLHSKRAAMATVVGVRDNLVTVRTKLQQSKPEVSRNTLLNVLAGYN